MNMCYYLDSQQIIKEVSNLQDEDYLDFDNCNCETNPCIEQGWGQLQRHKYDYDYTMITITITIRES